MIDVNEARENAQRALSQRNIIDGCEAQANMLIKWASSKGRSSIDLLLFKEFSGLFEQLRLENKREFVEWLREFGYDARYSISIQPYQNSGFLTLTRWIEPKKVESLTVSW